MSITIISKHLQLICCLLFFLYFTFSFSVCDKQCCSLFVTCQSGDLFLFFFFLSLLPPGEAQVELQRMMWAPADAPRFLLLSDSWF